MGETIKTGNMASAQARAKAMIFLRHHLHEDLKKEYLTVKDPLVLWQSLKDRLDHQKQVILPKARYARPTDSTELAEVNVTSNVKVAVGNTCRTSRHFVDLYQASLRNKGKETETNFIDNFNDDELYPNDDESNPNVRFDSSDFFDDVEDVVASFSNDENVN
ncbi:hypothetical protein Tco_1428160 [Tanacetum coccineum]